MVANLGTRVRLADGRTAVVFAAHWDHSGPPVAYQVRELVPNQYGERALISSLNDERVPASDCHISGVL